MLTVLDDGIKVHLTGRMPTLSNPLYLGSVLLLLLAIGLAIGLTVLNTKWAIGCMAGFAVLVFIFNHFRQRASTHTHICSGTLIAKKQQFSTDTWHIHLSADTKMRVTNMTLTICDHGRVWQITGFDNQKEVLITQAVLQGQRYQTQQKHIRLDSTDKK